MSSEFLKNSDLNSCRKSSRLCLLQKRIGISIKATYIENCTKLGQSCFQQDIYLDDSGILEQLRSEFRSEKQPAIPTTKMNIYCLSRLYREMYKTDSWQPVFLKGDIHLDDSGILEQFRSEFRSKACFVYYCKQNLLHISAI